jgi:hypothetical protein
MAAERLGVYVYIYVGTLRCIRRVVNSARDSAELLIASGRDELRDGSLDGHSGTYNDADSPTVSRSSSPRYDPRSCTHGPDLCSPIGQPHITVLASCN